MSRQPRLSTSGIYRWVRLIAPLYLLCGILFLVALPYLPWSSAVFLGVSHMMEYLFFMGLTTLVLALYSYAMHRRMQQAYEALRESQHYYHQQIEGASDAIYLANLNGDFCEVNERACDFWGYSRRELLAMNVQDVIDPEDLERQALQLVEMSKGSKVVFNRVFRCKDGTLVYGEVSGARLSESLVQGIIRDISVRRNTELLLRHRMEQAAAMNRLSRRVTASLSYEEVLSATYTHLISVLEASQVAVFRFQQGHLVYQVPAGLEDKFALAPADFWTKAWVRLLEQSPENTCYIPDVQLHPEYGPLVYEVKAMHALVIVPLKAGTELLGILLLAFSDSISFPSERIYLEASAAQIALALRNAQLHEESQAATRQLQGHIHQLQETEKAMRRSEQRFRSLVEATSDYVWEVDRKLIFSYASPRVYDMLGYSAHEVIGKSAFDFVEEEKQGEMQQFIQTKMSADEYIEHFEARLAHKDGFYISTETNAVPIFDASGVFSGYRGITRDITRRKNVEEQARLDRQQLVQADKMASLGILVSGVAHEVNNPNQLIMANVSLLQEAWQAVLPILQKNAEEEEGYTLLGMPYADALEELPAMFNEVTEGARRINRIVQELRDFARQAPPHMDESVDLDAVVTSATTLTGNMIRKSTSNYTLHLAGDLPHFKGNFQRLEQVAINLIQNACHALVDTGGGLQIATDNDKEAGVVRLTIRDEGVGIAEENLSKLCDPFFTTKRDIGGTGLGLSISANIVQEHGGDLRFSSRIGGPTVATIDIPLN